ncbi:MAG TPA: hypothetical protein VLH18_01935, partial [Candidatus Limnocylindrales bacterium]|nr:hypothetical protein [Candidatus Limnocylindrales bacterium]
MFLKWQRATFIAEQSSKNLEKELLREKAKGSWRMKPFSSESSGSGNLLAGSCQQWIINKLFLRPSGSVFETAGIVFFMQAMECTDADAEGNPSDLTYQCWEKLLHGEAGLASLEAISITDKNRSRLNQLRFS